MEPIAELVDAWFRYRRGGGWLLQGVSVSLAPGEAVLITGPNAAGKTTLLRILAGLLRPEKGELLVGGRSLWRLGEAERLRLRRSIVYVSEEPIVVKGTVLENIMLGLLLRRRPRSEAEEEARRAAELLGLTGLLGEKAHRLSRGQRQLVSIARALALRPRALLLDEPYAHLDTAKARLLTRILAALLQDGVALAVVSHNPLPLLPLKPRRLVLEEGRLREEPPEAAAP